MFHPSRGGVRGGKDQFSWEDVKEDKYREYYLGHSLMAPVGRWQKGKDLTWYSKETKDDKDRLQREELARIKEAEADAMAVALGVKKKRTIESNVTEEELRHAIKRNDDSDDDPLDKVNEEKGLGYGRSNRLIPAGGQTVEVMNEGSSYAVTEPNYGGPPLTGSSSAAFEYEPIDKHSSKEKKKKAKKHKKSSSEKKKRRHRHSSLSEESSDRRRRPESPTPSRHSRRHLRDAEPKGRSRRSRSRSRSPHDRSLSPPLRHRTHRRPSLSPNRDGRRSAVTARGRNDGSTPTPRKRDRRTSRSPSAPRERHRHRSRSPRRRHRSRSPSASRSSSPPTLRRRRSPSSPSSARHAPRRHPSRSASPPSSRRQRPVSPPPQPVRREPSRSPSPYTKRLLLTQKKGAQ